MKQVQVKGFRMEQVFSTDDTEDNVISYLGPQAGKIVVQGKVIKGSCYPSPLWVMEMLQAPPSQS